MVVTNQFKSSNGYHTYTSVQPNRDELTLVCESPIQLTGEKTDFYFAIPEPFAPYSEPDIPLSKGFVVTVYDENGNEVYCQVTEEDNSIHRSMVREMPTVDITRKVLTDLSANGGANCYLVKPGGTYKFYAGYRGGSTYPVPTAAVVDILWETKNSTEEAPGVRGIIQDGVYNSQTGYITFVSTGTPGGQRAVPSAVCRINGDGRIPSPTISSLLLPILSIISMKELMSLFLMALSILQL